MNKDNFYYLLRDRLEYAQDYLIDTSTYIKSVKFQEKVDKELFKDKIFLFSLTNLKNLLSITTNNVITNSKRILHRRICALDAEI